jgi:phospholipase C
LPITWHRRWVRVSVHEVKVGNVDVLNSDGTGSAFLGFRVPCLLIGPRARRGAIAGAQYDANAILNMISWNFGLPGLGVRATTSGNMATALNFSAPPNLTLPPAPNLVDQVFGSSCAANPMADMQQINKDFAEHFASLDAVHGLMLEHGFKLA